jgi:hypothetical protein
MVAFIVGVFTAAALIVFGRFTGYEKDKAFFPTLLIVIAFYYVLFAFLDNTVSTIIIELSVAAFFTLLAVWGGFRFPIIVGAGIVLHGLFDFVHGYLYSNSGVPVWWPAFCGSVDVFFGLWVIYFTYKTKNAGLPEGQLV